MILPSCAAAHASPTLVSEYGALARDVGYTTPEMSKRTVEQIVDDPEDDEQVLFGYQAKSTSVCTCSRRTKR